ncbi:MAG: DsbC family protein [Gammaproteobacteria bacterium]
MTTLNLRILVVAAPLLMLSAAHAGPKEDIAAMVPGLTADDVTESPIPGVYEVVVGGQIVYITGDKRYLLKGEIVDLATNESVTEARRSSVRLRQMAQVKESEMIIFEPENPKHTITVFTDIDCGYCRKLHQEMDQMQALGIRVRYMFYPRMGPGSEGWAKAEAVWCSDDRQQALTDAKLGKKIDAPSCGATPVAAEYEMGNRIGVRGTPAIMTEDGSLLPGYVPAAELAAYLEKS